MTRVKLAVIGAGHLGRIHTRLLSGMDDVELVGVADPLTSACEAVAGDCHVTAFADHRELVDRVDGAVIATPTRTHHTVALDFLRRGVPVLIEKPLAASLAEADALVHAAHTQGVIAQVGHIERFNPAFTAAAPHVREPLYIDAVRASGFTGRSTDIGVVHDLMIHDLDLILTLADSPLISVTAMGLAVLGTHEDVAQARLEFENGCIANLSASRVSFAPSPRRQMQIWTAHGFAAIDFGNRTSHVVHPSAAVAERRFDYNTLTPEEKAGFQERVFTEILRVEPLVVETRNALSDELREFIGSIRGTATPRVTMEAGREAVSVAEEILNSIRDHAWHGQHQGPVGPLALPQRSILRGPHWQPSPHPHPIREAG